jgi:hypothetical protein
MTNQCTEEIFLHDVSDHKMEIVLMFGEKHENK